MSEQGSEPPEDDGSSSADPHGPLPSPDDRLWRHPAEVAAELRAQSERTAASTRSSGRSSNLVAAVVAVVGGGLLVTGLWVVMSSTSTTSVARAGGSFGAVLDRAAVESTGTSTIDLSVVDLRSIDGIELGRAVALRTGVELVGSLDLDPGTPLEAILPDGSRQQATVVGHDGLTGVSAVRLDGDDVPGASIESHGDVVASDQPPMATETRADGWSHATMAVAAPDADPGDVVVDDDGKVTALVTSRTDEGATATPIAVVARVAAQLFESGEAAHPWLGVRARDARDGEGVVITHVVPGSPADRHGIDPGMVITGVGQAPVVSVGELLTELRSHRPGDRVTIELLSGAATRRVVLAVGDTVDAPG